MTRLRRALPAPADALIDILLVAVAYVRGICVAGRVDDLPELLERHRPTVVVIAEREGDPASVRRVLERCRDADVRVRAVRGFGLARTDRSPLRPIAIEGGAVKLVRQLARELA